MTLLITSITPDHFPENPQDQQSELLKKLHLLNFCGEEDISSYHWRSFKNNFLKAEISNFSGEEKEILKTALQSLKFLNPQRRVELLAFLMESERGECEPLIAIVLDLCSSEDLKNFRTSPDSDVFDQTLLHLAAKLNHAVTFRHLNVAKKAIDAGVDIQALDERGSTAMDLLDMTASHTEKFVIGMLTWKKKGIHDKVRTMTDKEGNGLVHYAVLSSSLSVMQKMADLGDNLNAINANGRTPLHITVRAGNVAMAGLLLDRRADPFVKNGNGENFFDLIMKEKPVLLVKFVVKIDLPSYPALDSAVRKYFTELQEAAKVYFPLTDNHPYFSMKFLLIFTRCLGVDLLSDLSLDSLAHRCFVYSRETDNKFSDNLIDEEKELFQEIEETIFSQQVAGNINSLENRRKFNYEGIYSYDFAKLDTWLWQSFEEALIHLQMDPKEKDVLTAIAQTNQSVLTKESIFLKIQQGEPVCFEIGFLEHSAMLIIFPYKQNRSYFVICNRGPRPEIENKRISTVIAYCVDHTKIEQQHIDSLFALTGKQEEEFLDLVYENLPTLLSDGQLVKDDFCKGLEAIAPRNQQVCNCPWASRKTAVRVLLGLVAALTGSVGSPCERVKQAKSNSKSFSTHMRVLALEAFDPSIDFSGYSEVVAKVIKHARQLPSSALGLLSPSPALQMLLSNHYSNIGLWVVLNM